MIKIKVYTISKLGTSSKIIALPKVWLDDNNLKHKDKIEMFRDNINGRDCLIIAKRGK